MMYKPCGDKPGRQTKGIINDVTDSLAMTATAVFDIIPFPLTCPTWGGKRYPKMQKTIFQMGWSNADGILKLSNHQNLDRHGKCLALDFGPYNKESLKVRTSNGIVFGSSVDYKDTGKFGFLAATMFMVFDDLKAQGLIPKNEFLHWGGLWKSKTGDLGWDIAHFEIRNYPQTPQLN